MQLVPTLTADDAATMLSAAIAAAVRAEAAVTIAVVDAGGTLLALTRMHGARGYSVDLATRKARTSAAIGVGTSVLAAMYATKPAPADMMTMPGGLPVISAAHSAGAIGVSGANTEVDEIIAEAGVSALVSA